MLLLLFYPSAVLKHIILFLFILFYQHFNIPLIFFYFIQYIEFLLLKYFSCFILIKNNFFGLLSLSFFNKFSFYQHLLKILSMFLSLVFLINIPIIYLSFYHYIWQFFIYLSAISCGENDINFYLSSSKAVLFSFCCVFFRWFYTYLCKLLIFFYIFWYLT